MDFTNFDQIWQVLVLLGIAAQLTERINDRLSHRYPRISNFLGLIDDGASKVQQALNDNKIDQSEARAFLKVAAKIAPKGKDA